MQAELPTEMLKRRILYGQFLTAPSDPITVCRALNGIQAQYLSNAHHALRIRSSPPLPADRWPNGLAKSWTVRGTMHLFAEEDLPLYLHTGRTHFLRPQDKMQADEFITLERKQQFADWIVEQIRQGIDTREELKTACMAAGLTEVEAQSVFDPWGGTLRCLAESGTICFQVQEKKAYRLCPPFAPMDGEAARVEQLRRYFTHYGPATVKDAAYYFGASQSTVRKGMEQLPLQGMEAEGKTRYRLPQPGEPEEHPPIPPCIFLAGFDPLLLGYQKQESLFLPPEYLRGIFTLAGIVMPAVLLDGTVAGRWKKTKTRLTVSLFRELTAAEERQLRTAAAQTFPELKKVELARI